MRDLMDSLHKGFPIRYIIAWKNPNIRLKDGSISKGKKVLIDGQQRITALQKGSLTAEVVGRRNYVGIFCHIKRFGAKRVWFGKESRGGYS